LTRSPAVSNRPEEVRAGMIHIQIKPILKSSSAKIDPDPDQFDRLPLLAQNDLDMDQFSKEPNQARIRTSQELGAQIRLERHNRNLSQAELAARSGVSRRFIYQLENGSRDSFPLGKVLQVIRRLNLELQIVRRTAE
jgi:predicted XRE-type DNA-binding protein